MNEGFIPRKIADLAEETLQDTPVLIVSGARQVGKTTLLKSLLESRPHRFVNLDEKAVREAAIADPEGFVEQFPDGTFAIDEIQRVPQLVLAIKSALEKARRPGRFAATGSANLANLKGVEESLAGRAEAVRLWGFSRGELDGGVADFAALAWRLGEGKAAPPSNLPSYTRRQYIELVLSSTFPELRSATPRSTERWYENYLKHIFSRDIPDLAEAQFPDRFPRLLDLIAAQNSAEFVASTAARALDIPARSVPTYLQLLQDVYLIQAIPAWSTNATKRVISRPKVVLADQAMAAFLTGVDADGLEQQISSSLTGGFFEAFVATELLKQRAWSKIRYGLFHFRDRDGREVDLVLENRRREIVGVEVKAAVSLSRKDFAGLQFLRDRTGSSFRAGVVLYAGTEALPFGDRLWALPLSVLWA